MSEIYEKSAAELAAGLAAGEYSSVEITSHFINRISKLDANINAFITVCADSALESASAADQKRAAGTATVLTGVPFAHKDIFCTRGIRTSCGSRMLDNFIAPYDAHVVERLATNGMVMLGKTNMDEFAMGSSNETSFYGRTCNPWDLSRVPGGSSGGSAAAVAARMVPLATATDTGGSIRQPAALCGVTGLKPTYGRVSRYGMIAFASSLDQGGPMGQNAEDVALLLEAMAGFDRRDSTSADRPVDAYRELLDADLQGVTIGVPDEYFGAELDSNIGDIVHGALDQLVARGAKLKTLSLPNAALAIPAYYVIAPAECSSNLSRYDGVRFGYRCEDPNDLEDLYSRSRGEAFGEEVKRRILVGTYALSSGYYDAYYRKAQQIRRLIKDDFVTALKEVDVIAGPTTPGIAFQAGERNDDPVSMYLSDVYTTAANLSGHPAMSLPVGQHDGLPVGMQFIGDYFDEARMLSLAHAYQQDTDWHLRRPAAAG